MARSCSICSHPNRPEIEADLVRGTPFRNIAERFGTSTGAVFRHRAHVSGTLAKARDAVEASRGDDLLGRVQHLVSEADAILREARGVGEGRNPELALKAIDRLTKLTELFARLAGELREGTTVNVAVVASPDWLALRSRILGVLEPFPAARQALVVELAATTGGMSRV